jgi:hypothetical protein
MSTDDKFDMVLVATWLGIVLMAALAAMVWITLLG